MIHLHYSNRLEKLIEPLAKTLAQQQSVRPLERVTIVVPNRAVEQFLKHRMAATIGIAANLEFPFLRSFLARVLETVDPKARILDLEELELVLFESLRAALRNPSGDFESPRGYIETTQGGADDKDFRTFRLARRVAWLFREYSIARRPMLKQWFRTGSAEELTETAKWQKHLWISTFDSNGCLREEWKENHTSDWRLLSYAFDAIAAPQLRTALPEIVHVFGLAYAGPAYIRIFSQIGNLTELHIYTMNPCREFWEDVEPLSSSARRSLLVGESRTGGDLEPDVGLSNPAAPEDTPALRLWARPGREYFRMLNELTDSDFEAYFDHRDSPRSSLLLSKLQDDILNREPQRQTGVFELPLDDGSIRFLACPGIAREAEIVANEIWAIVERRARTRDPIRFHQIGVMIPDALYANYLPHVEGAFARLGQLPMNIVNRGAGNQSRVGEAISMLLRFPLGRFSRDEMLHLMRHPALRGADPQWEPDQASRWCDELGIFFGADGDDLADTYIPRDTFHWDQGLRRLAAGVFMGTESDQEPRFYATPNFSEYLPYATPQDEVAAVAAFIKQARLLLSDAIYIRSQRLTLAQWAMLLTNLIVTHVQVDEATDERVLERCIDAIESIAQLELRSEPLSYRIAHEILAARISARESRLAKLNENGIAIGPLSALRSIPFRTIFLLGLSEAHFPERDPRDPMDLRSPRKLGDVSSAERDRYLFLETLLAAKERICLSYIARDATTGDRLEPSSVVHELKSILRGYVSCDAIAQMTIEHPLSRYDSSYFRDTGLQDASASRALVSYDPVARRGAAMAALRRDLAHHAKLPLPGRDEPIFERLSKNTKDAMRRALKIVDVPPRVTTELGTPLEISLPIAALRRFLECPLQGAAQYALGIFEEESEDLENSRDEPIAQSILDRTMLLREVFWKSAGDKRLVLDVYAKLARLSQLAGEAPAGPFYQAAQRTDAQNLDHWIEQAKRAGCTDLDRWQEVRIGRGDEFAKGERIVSDLMVPLRIETPSGAIWTRVVRIHGSLGFISPNGDASLRLVLRDKPKTKDFLAAFLSAIVLTAAGELNGKHFHAIVVGAGKNKSWSDIRRPAPLTTEQARGYLSDLLADLLFGKNHYFLPIEAVEDVNNEMARDADADLVDIINDTRDNEFAKCSSDYGPIRDARRFEPPSARELKGMMERRFGLIRSIFKREKA